MSFRLWMIFYVFALFASAMATFGISGIFATLFVAGFWATVYTARGKPTLIEWLLIIVVAIVCIGPLLPAVKSVRGLTHLSRSKNNLKNLALALLYHESRHGTLPPASQEDSSALKNSWRVSILPKLERSDIYEKLDLSKYWDDPANRAVTSAAIEIFQCPGHTNGSTTNYFAIVGRRSAWPEAGGRRIREIKDGPANTILLMEASDRGVQWAEPRDLTFDEAVDLLSKPPSVGDGHPVDNGFFYKPCIVRNVAFADGHVASINLPLDRKFAESLLTANGGEIIDLAAINAVTQPELNYARCYALGLFVILSLTPAIWVFRPMRNPQHDQ